MNNKVGKESKISEEVVDYRQTLPEWMRVLSDKEIDALSKYKHSSGKTSYESWLQAGPCYYAEKMFPSFLSANCLTIIGQLPLQITMILVLLQVGPNIDVNESVPRYLMIAAGISLQWFSWVDIMDGNRARRLKCGSPLGRMIDEGGDTVTMANYSVLCAYAWQLQNPMGEIVYFAMNSVFFAMEMRYAITGELVMAVGEVSSVEAELLFSLTLIYTGVYGQEGLQKTIGQSFGVEAGSPCPLHVICEYKWVTVLGFVLCLA